MKMGKRGEGYVAIQAALLLLVFGSGLRSKPRSSLAAKLGAVLMLAGTALGLWSGRLLGRNLTPLPQPIEDGELVTSGAYAFARHPIYSALLLLSAGWALRRVSRQGALWTVLLAALFDRKAAFEESQLAAKYPGYPSYQQRVGKFFPKWRYVFSDTP